MLTAHTPLTPCRVSGWQQMQLDFYFFLIFPSFEDGLIVFSPGLCAAVYLLAHGCPFSIHIEHGFRQGR